MASGVLAFGGAGAALVFGTDSMDWSVDGVAYGGSGVVIAFPGGYSPCRGEPHIAVTEENDEQIEIRVRLRRSTCGNLKSLRLYHPTKVWLAAPVAGRNISGPGRVEPVGELVPRGFLVSDNRMPDLVGLDLNDAKAAARAHNLTVNRSMGSGRTVTGQKLPAGGPLPTSVAIQTDG